MAPRPRSTPIFIHLHVHSPYSFLDGASPIENLVRRAAELGMSALALTDHDNLCAAVKFTTLCNSYHVRPILGAEATMDDESHLTLLAATRAGYANLCGLLTISHATGGRLNPRLPWAQIEDGGLLGGIVCLSGCRRGKLRCLIREHRYDQARDFADRMRNKFDPGCFFIELQDDYTPDSLRVCRELALLGVRRAIPTVATNNVHYALPEDAVIHDVLRCTAAHVTVNEPHESRPLNAEQYLKSDAEMRDLFAWSAEAIENTTRIASICGEALPEPADITPFHDAAPHGYRNAAEHMRALTWVGANRRYAAVTHAHRTRIERELSVIIRFGYADYFLMVRDIVAWARRQGIRATGRGSAADSAVAYCLNITDIDAIARDLPFARFVAEGKVPDIDVDFPSDRRDEVFRYIVQAHGAEHVAAVCTFHTYWARSAVRDIGKALCLPEEALEFLSKRLSLFTAADRIAAAFDKMAELKPHAHLTERFQLLFSLCARIAGFPRHLGSHSSGVVISRVPLATIAPLQPSARGVLPIWTLDKDDAEEVGAIKFDVLALRMLSATGDAETDIRRRRAEFEYDRIPADDPATYQLLQSGKAIGAFQFESAAQLSLAVTLLPSQFEDLVAAVALIRPGPIRGRAVQKFVAARNGYAPVRSLHPSLETIVAKTYGCIVFQEQVVQTIAAMYGCSDAQADKVRKGLTKHTQMGTLDKVRAEFVERSCARHPELGEKRANLIFDQLESWGSLGFIEGHAAAFALTGYRSGYLSVHHAAEFFAGLMNHQPMGYYAANSLAAEARRRGVNILPVEINGSADKCRSEDGAIRLGLRMVVGLREDDIARIAAERDERGEFASLLDFCARLPLRRDSLESLILCGAFENLPGFEHQHRRGLMLALDQTLDLASTYRAARDPNQHAFDLGGVRDMRTPTVWEATDFSPWEKYLWSWRITSVCAECHVFAHLRETISARGVLSAYDALRQPHGARVRVAGLNIRPHRPPTRSGNPVLFVTIEDETDIVQAICTGDAIDRCTSTFLLAPAVIVEGIIERKGRGMMLQVERVAPLLMSKLQKRGSVPFYSEIRPGTEAEIIA
jgi:error-prone DNA polymerase